MRVGLVTGTRSLELVELPQPEPSPGRAVVKIAYCGICGTDLHAWTHGGAYSPAICGHEWSGTVSAVPSDVKRFREGDRVTLGIAAPCGQCAECRRGDGAHCTPAFLGMIGLGPLAGSHGGFAPSLAFDAERLIPLPSDVSDEAAALVEPATVAVHAVRRAGLQLGDTAVVVGAGPIGLLTLQCAIAGGAGAVLVIEPQEFRRNRAAELGASAVVDPTNEDVAERIAALFGRVGPDFVFECAGIPSTIQLSADWVRRGGTVALVGVAALPAEIQPGGWLAREIRLVASLGYQHEEFALTLGLIQDGRIRTAPLHTKTVGLEEMPAAFELLHEDPTEIKILVDPRRS